MNHDVGNRPRFGRELSISPRPIIRLNERHPEDFPRINAIAANKLPKIRGVYSKGGAADLKAAPTTLFTRRELEEGVATGGTSDTDKPCPLQTNQQPSRCHRIPLLAAAKG